MAKAKKAATAKRSSKARKPARKPARAKRAKAPATAAVLADLDKAFKRLWAKEPAEVRRLRDHALPPMGTMPCMLYANFNTFWMGENVQVLRQMALDRSVSVAALNATAAALLARHAARLAKWRLTGTVKLLHRLIEYFEGGGASNHREFVAVAEALMMVGNRVNAWIDAAVPWSLLDRKVKPFPPPA